MSDAKKSVLFACNMNSVRSPMAEALARKALGDSWEVQSCGVYAGILDPFVPQIVAEVGAEVPNREPQTFSRVDIGQFDIVIALTPEAAAEARRLGARVEFWETPNPTDIRGDDAAMFQAYRDTRDFLDARIRKDFGVTGG